MDDTQVLTPEDDLFGRIAVFNRLVSLNQIVECGRTISAEVLAGRPRHTLASVLIAKGYLAPAAAAAIEREVRKRAAAREGEAPPLAPGLETRPKPMKRPAGPGDSQVMIPIRADPKGEDGRFRVSVSEAEESATLEADCVLMSPKDAPVIEAACRRLVQTGQPDLCVDLSRVQHVPSTIIGELAKVNADAHSEGQRLVILCNAETAGLIQLLLGDFIRVRVC